MGISKDWYLVREGSSATIKSKHLLKALAEKAKKQAEENRGIPFNPVTPQAKYVVMHKDEWNRKNKRRSFDF